MVEITVENIPRPFISKQIYLIEIDKPKPRSYLGWVKGFKTSFEMLNYKINVLPDYYVALGKVTMNDGKFVVFQLLNTCLYTNTNTFHTAPF